MAAVVFSGFSPYFSKLVTSFVLSPFIHRQPIRWRSFRVQLTLWLGGLSLVSLLAASLYIGRIATQELAVQGMSSLRLQAHNAAQMLDLGLYERQREVNMLAQNLSWMDVDLRSSELKRVLDVHQHERQEYAWLGIADRNGVVLHATDDVLLGQQVSGNDWFEAGLYGAYTGGVHDGKILTKMIPPATTGEPLRLIDFSAPVRDARGQVRAVIGSHAHWGWVTSVVESALRHGQHDQQIEVLIADRAGHILYPQKWAGQLNVPQSASSKQLLVHLSKPSDGRSDLPVVWGDGSRYMSTAVTAQVGVPNPLGWQVIVRQPEAVALQPVHALRWKLIWLGCLQAALFAACAYGLAIWLSRPLEQLALAVRTIEQEHHVVVVSQTTRIDELHQLAFAIDSMAQTLLTREQDLEDLNVSLELQVHERTQALHDANEALELLATTDALTGLVNRRRLDEKLLECFLALPRLGRHFAVLMLDADHFKRINDVYGHPIGDVVLQQLASVVRLQTRITDTVARFGGEEFCVLLPAIADEREPMIVAEKIRAAVQAHTFPEVGKVTVSVGVSVSAFNDTTVAEVIRRADTALYKAKSQGRNAVERVLPVGPSVT